MALKRAEMYETAESARIRALNAAGGRVYEGHHPETRYEPNRFCGLEGCSLGRVLGHGLTYEGAGWECGISGFLS
jgi:hypothetical protein